MSGRAISVGLLAMTLVCPQAALAAQAQAATAATSREATAAVSRVVTGPADQHIADTAALRKAVAAKAAVDRENRKAIATVLDRSDVQAVAKKMGLDVKRAQSAVTTLEGAQLADLASLARNAEHDLAGGDKTIVISVTTLLLLLILIVLIVG
jgi:hypothetical protein